jgi:hypothetical protein
VKPPRVKDKYEYWLKPPPDPSPRCTWWLGEFAKGWQPNRRVRGEGYTGAADFYGVYVWEYLNVIAPLESQAASSGGSSEPGNR